MENQIKSQVEALDIDPKSKELIGKLIAAELFRVLYTNHYNVKELKIVKYEHDNEEDKRVWVEVSLLINFGDPVPIYQFRPFSDTCQMQSVSGGITLRKTYFLYRED